jgi:hypothetical protein
MGIPDRYKWSFSKRRNIDIKIVKPFDQPLWNKCERLEYEIFRACDYVPISAECRIDDFDCYPTMEFLAAFEKSGKKSYIEKKLFGTLRVVYSPREKKIKKESFPTLHHAKRLDYNSNESQQDYRLKPPYEDNETLWLYADIYDWLMSCDPRKFVDWAAMAVTKEGSDIKATANLLGRAVKRAWGQPPIKYCFVAADLHIAKRYKEKIPQIVDLGPPVIYWGSKTLPFLVDLYQLPKGVQKLLILVYRIKRYMKIWS